MRGGTAAEASVEDGIARSGLQATGMANATARRRATELERARRGLRLASWSSMIRSVGLKLIKVTVLMVALGLGASACWVHDGYGHDGRYAHDDHHGDRHDDRR